MDSIIVGPIKTRTKILAAADLPKSGGPSAKCFCHQRAVWTKAYRSTTAGLSSKLSNEPTGIGLPQLKHSAAALSRKYHRAVRGKCCRNHPFIIVLEWFPDLLAGDDIPNTCLKAFAARNNAATIPAQIASQQRIGVPDRVLRASRRRQQAVIWCRMSAKRIATQRLPDVIR